MVSFTIVKIVSPSKDLLFRLRNFILIYIKKKKNYIFAQGFRFRKILVPDSFFVVNIILSYRKLNLDIVVLISGFKTGCSFIEQLKMNDIFIYTSRHNIFLYICIRVLAITVFIQVVRPLATFEKS